MDIFIKLNSILRNQDFSHAGSTPANEAELRNIASVYARVENAIVVLSDMSINQSTIFYGALADTLGISKPEGNTHDIPSIWEDEILNSVHPDDLPLKYGSELQFFDFVASRPIDTRTRFCLWCDLRMADKDGKWMNITHRMFYLDFDDNGCPRKALCLYTPSTAKELNNTKITDTTTGEEFPIGHYEQGDMLTKREIGILKLIGEGYMSKEIATMLEISQNTVNRHRQNILAKMHANNSMEAFRKAVSVGLKV